jgi:hypothetical protein
VCAWGHRALVPGTGARWGDCGLRAEFGLIHLGLNTWPGQGLGGTLAFMAVRSRWVVALALVLGALAFSACGGAESESTSTARASTPDSVGGDDGSGDQQVLILPTASGGQIDFNDLLGSPTMLWFWAPW